MTTRTTESRGVSLRRVLALALPSLGVLAATPLYILLDTAVVGHLGAVDLAALAAATTILAQVTTQLTFLSYGTTARAGRYFGAGQRQRAIGEGVQATWVAIIIGTILGLVVWFLAPTLVSLLADDGDVTELGQQWLRIAAPVVPLMLIIMAGNGWLRGIQEVRRPLYFTLAGVIPAAVLVPVLVHHFGMRGSAVATVISESLTALCFLVALVREHNESWRPQWSIIRSQLVMGRDLIGRALSFQISFVSAAAVAARFGPAALGAHQVMLQLWNFLSLTLDSLAIAAQALVGSALGAGMSGHARRVGRQIIGYSLGFGVVLSALMLAGYRLVPRIFTSDSAVLDQISSTWILFALLIIVCGIVFGADGVLLGAGDATFLRNATIASALLGFLPLIWLSLHFGWGLRGVWWGLVAFMLLRMATVMTRFLRGHWAITGVERDG